VRLGPLAITDRVDLGARRRHGGFITRFITTARFDLRDRTEH
jgi:hypothetical protein